MSLDKAQWSRRLLARLEQFARLRPVGFEQLDGWDKDDHLAAFGVFRAFSMALLRSNPVLRVAQQLPSACFNACEQAAASSTIDSVATARRFFESGFRAFRIEPNGSVPNSDSGFLTGYYEPVVQGSLHPSPEFSEPLMALPGGHVKLTRPSEEYGLPTGLNAALKLSDGKLSPYPERSAIDRGNLSSHTRPIVWVRDGVEAFMIHVQGSARITVEGGKSLRVKYAGRNGHPYTSIGRILLQSGQMTSEQMSLKNLKEWVRTAGLAPGQPGRELLHRNKSFIFFQIDHSIPENKGPIGGAGVYLHPLRSIAIDRTIWPYGLPFWIDAKLPWRSNTQSPFQRLLISDDTGSAIRGPARADIFFGSGERAGALAGGIRHSGQFTVLLPM